MEKMYALSVLREFFRDENGYLPYTTEYAEFWRSLSEVEKDEFTKQAAKALNVEVIPVTWPEVE